ncbi:MAG: site-specific DNA-methyltransferase [Planctomycetes bacterium]|nr:site-specific DNA-methyltransferase [Planctomycetota bacterium]
MLAINKIHRINALEGLKQLPDESIDCVMTSPPYWSMRDYGIKPTKWSDGSKSVLGLEHEIRDYVNHLLSIFEQVKRVLKKSGTVWVNLGDVYAGSWGNYAPNGVVSNRRATGKHKKWLRQGIVNPQFRPPSSRKQLVRNKSLSLIPEQFVLGMAQQGWILRNRIVWHKPNHMPSSVKDRFTNSWEHLFLFSKSKKYYFDLDSVREPHLSLKKNMINLTSSPKIRVSHHPTGKRLPPKPGDPQAFHPKGKNPGDCWDISTRSFKSVMKGKGNGQGDGNETGDAHFAVYPEQLCERPIKAGCPRGGIILDPFMGSGTTAVVAKKLGRSFIGLELNPEYVKMARQRLRHRAPSRGQSAAA